MTDTPPFADELCPPQMPQHGEIRPALGPGWMTVPLCEHAGLRWPSEADAGHRPWLQSRENPRSARFVVAARRESACSEVQLSCRVETRVPRSRSKSRSRSSSAHEYYRHFQCRVGRTPASCLRPDPVSGYLNTHSELTLGLASRLESHGGAGRQSRRLAKGSRTSKKISKCQGYSALFTERAHAIGFALVMERSEMCTVPL